MGGAIFENETELIYDSKQASLFIQINKPLFRQGQLGESSACAPGSAGLYDNRSKSCVATISLLLLQFISASCLWRRISCHAAVPWTSTSRYVTDVHSTVIHTATVYAYSHVRACTCTRSCCDDARLKHIFSCSAYLETTLNCKSWSAVARV